MHAASRPQPAVAECRVLLDGPHIVEVDVEVGQRLVEAGVESDVEEAVGQQPPREEFGREIVDALAGPRVGHVHRLHPLLDQTIAHRKRRGVEPVARRRRDAVLAERIEEAVGDRPAQRIVVASGPFALECGRRYGGRHGLNLVIVPVRTHVAAPHWRPVRAVAPAPATAAERPPVPPPAAIPRSPASSGSAQAPRSSGGARCARRSPASCAAPRSAESKLRPVRTR
jgi:hypothetical protein